MDYIPIRCIVVDDEYKVAEHMSDFVNKTPFLELVGVSTNPFEALAWVQEGKAELAFLDLNMQELHGLDFIRMSAGKCQFIIFSGYPEFAVEGFELDVLDFVKKPVSYERFLKAAGKALQAIRIQTPARRRYSFFKVTGRQHAQKVDHLAIRFIQSENKECIVYTVSDKITTPTTLSEIETMLPENTFLRVHKSYIVSIDHIDRVNGNTIIIGNKFIPVGPQYQEKFLRAIS